MAVTLLSWAYLAHMGQDMSGSGGGESVGPGAAMAMPRLQAWGATELTLLFSMWVIMMVAMMVPSVTPLVLTFLRADQRRGTRRVAGRAAGLVSGYILAWLAFSLVATAGQGALHSIGLMSPMMVSTSTTLGGLILVTAGLFQFTPLKRACLRRCRSPAGFLMEHWQRGRRGVVGLGLRHGLYCVGCCWALMALLFVAGVMNLLWVAAIAGFVLVEKMAPRGDTLGHLAGAAMVAFGVLMLVG